MNDWEVTRAGTVWLFRPLTDAARDWAADSFADATEDRGSYVVEYRYAMPILADLVNEHGFEVALDGRIVDAVEENWNW